MANSHFLNLEPISQFERIELGRFFSAGSIPFRSPYTAGVVACYHSPELVEFKMTVGDGSVPFIAFRDAVQQAYRDTPVKRVIWDRIRADGRPDKPFKMKIRK